MSWERTPSPAALRAAKRVEPAAVALCRARREVGAERLRQAPLGASPLALRDRLRRLLVQLGGRARRSAPVGEAGDDDREASWPRLISSRSPTLTSRAGLTRSSFTCTCPPTTAPVAAPRVLKNRAAHSHLSILTRSNAGTSHRTLA